MRRPLVFMVQSPGVCGHAVARLLDSVRRQFPSFHASTPRVYGPAPGVCGPTAARLLDSVRRRFPSLPVAFCCFPSLPVASSCFPLLPVLVSDGYHY